MKNSEEKSKGILTTKDISRMAVDEGALGLEFSWNYPRQMNMSYTCMMFPLLKKIYKDDPEGLRKSMVRNMEFFNITPQLAPFVGGIAASMEEEVAKGNLPGEAVSSVKSALMGPLSGIGDSIFLGCIRIIALGVGLALSQQGNFLGPILYILIYNIPAFLCRIYGARLGYKVGVNYLNSAEQSGAMAKILEAAGILGIMTIGAMTPTMFWASLNITVGTGDSAVTLQSILDGIMPGLLALGFTWLFYWLLGKKISPNHLVLYTLLAGIVFAALGIMVA